MTAKDISFTKLPANAAELQALPEAKMDSPFATAALAVAALAAYPGDAAAGIAMLNVLKGPQPLSVQEQQFLKDRFAGQEYLPRSYFKGAVPGNDYQPALPYTVHVSENPHTYDTAGYAKVYVDCGGADSPRPVNTRQAKDGKWYLWEFSSLVTGIRQPESSNPWA